MAGQEPAAAWGESLGNSAQGAGPWSAEQLGSDSMQDSQRVAITETLMDQFHADIYRYAYWLTGCRSSAEDITQDVFAKAFRGLHRLREMRAAKSWLMTIARNEYSRWCKKLPPKLRIDDDGSFEPCVSEESAPAGDNLEWVQKGLEELPSEFRLAVLMYYFEGLSYAQIAEELSVPIGTVMSRLSRGRMHLKSALERLAAPKQTRTIPDGGHCGR